MSVESEFEEGTDMKKSKFTDEQVGSRSGQAMRICAQRLPLWTIWLALLKKRRLAHLNARCHQRAGSKIGAVVATVNGLLAVATACHLAEPAWRAAVGRC